MLSDAEMIHYSRQILLPEVEEIGQHRLKQACVLIVGLGGLGCAAAQYLTGAGIGKLLLADGDRLSPSNLPRQPLYSSQHSGQLKAQLSARRLAAQNPHIDILPITEYLRGEGLYEQVSKADLVLDCSDNMASRQAINAACYAHSTALIIGAAMGFSGQFLALNPAHDHGCYRCLYEPEQAPPQGCQHAGVIGPVVAMMGLMQALEGIKYLANTGSVPWGTLHLFDGLKHSWQHYALPRTPQCQICGDR
ncbi:HesA/MoeB/ThiF family protein [Lacimicrobium alkaliphilum]|uniref:Molybdopterin biosynthesis protein MoeB n=1 Tax=Lacimicrobium alkaliphilum TaxID=1526571 RepID=A0ABQ1RER8_9ALTE|nr:HesA/MoeB/ThiF family protein [Lacimicrobium alkaliphilum]GGD65848.1 molybdopterin biosynthesis protein MoeB [Lacimicrobium alkaliphilum]